MLMIGLARLGLVAKPVPCPVVGGVLAAFGALQNLSVIEFSTGEPIDPDGESRHAGLLKLLPRYDFLIALLILVATLLAGFVWAVLTGIVVVSLCFSIA